MPKDKIEPSLELKKFARKAAKYNKEHWLSPCCQNHSEKISQYEGFSYEQLKLYKNWTPLGLYRKIFAKEVIAYQQSKTDRTIYYEFLGMKKLVDKHKLGAAFSGETFELEKLLLGFRYIIKTKR